MLQNTGIRKTCIDVISCSYIILLVLLTDHILYIFWIFVFIKSIRVVHSNNKAIFRNSIFMVAYCLEQIVIKSGNSTFARRISRDVSDFHVSNWIYYPDNNKMKRIVLWMLVLFMNIGKMLNKTC